MGYGRGYKYAHDFDDAYAPQAHLPETLEGRIFYDPSDRGEEAAIRRRLEKWRDLKARAGRKEKDEAADPGQSDG